MSDTTTLTTREQFLADVLTTAVEGGIGYWARIYDQKRSEALDWLEITLVDHVGVYDDDTGNLDGLLQPFDNYESLDDLVIDGNAWIDTHYKHVVTLDDIANAIGRIIDPESEISLANDIVADVLGANRFNDAGFGGFDAITADAIVQVAALGDVIYG